MQKRNESKNDDLKKIVIFIIVILIVIVFALIINKIKKLEKYTPNNVEIKYNQTNNKIKEGIYITDVSEVVEEVMPSIVSITSKTLVSQGLFDFPYIFGGGSSQERYSEGAGSGIIISKTNDELLILTNNHVVEDSKELVVKFIDDSTVNATIKGTSERKDVAVISVKLSDIKKETSSAISIAVLGDSNTLKVGNGVIAIGNALGYGQSVTTGVVSALNREVKTDNYSNKMIQIDAAINGGNSGGALLNNRGEVVGINSAKYSSNGYSSSASIEGMGFAIPISDVKTLIDDLANGKEVSEGATIGVQGYIVTEEYSEAYNMPQGFYISSIVKGSGADKSKLEIGNIITKIDKVEVKSFEDLSEYLYTKKKNDVVTLTVQYVSGRSYKVKTIKVTLS